MRWEVGSSNEQLLTEQFAGALHVGNALRGFSRPEESPTKIWNCPTSHWLAGQ